MATDFISRDEAAKVLCMACGNAACDPFECSFYMEMEDIPAADVRPVVHGGWRPNPRNPFWLNCTVCGYAKSERMIYNFCPNCGADMREVNRGEK